jgi:hypothetical protein
LSVHPQKEPFLGGPCLSLGLLASS